MSVTLISDELRGQVVDLHGSRCLRCGVQCTWSGPTKLHIDHIVPEVRGGLTILSNLQVLCRTCNLSKGASTADYRKPADSRDWFTRANGTVAGHFATRAGGTVVCQCGWSTHHGIRHKVAVRDWSLHLDNVATPAEQARAVAIGVGC